MSQTTEFEQPILEEKEYSKTNLHFSDSHCKHYVVRNEERVECTKCGAGWTDPKRTFPIEDFNL